MKNTAAEAIRECWKWHNACRGLVPYIPENAVGASALSVAPWYRQHCRASKVQLSKPLTHEDRCELNRIAHWLNQSYVIRLHSILDENHLQRAIDGHTPGHVAVDLVKRLRKVLAHTHGRYNSSRREEKQLYKDIVEFGRLKNRNSDIATQWPLDIDKVLRRLTEDCCRYAESKCAI